MFTGKARDVVTNTFHFVDGEDDIEAASLDILEQLRDFYDTAYGAPTNRASYLDWAAAKLSVADLDEPIPRTIYEYALLFAAGTGASTIPTEVAVVASWKAAPVPGIRYQSLYNRVYLGGLAGSVIQAGSASTFPTISSSFIASVNAAMVEMWTPTLGPRLSKWVQYGMNGVGGVGVARGIIGGFTDNSPDTQRRRSVDYSVRTSWVPVP